MSSCCLPVQTYQPLTRVASGRQDDALSQYQTTERELEEARGALSDHQTQLERCQQELAAGRTERQYLETRITTTQSDCSSYVSPHARSADDLVSCHYCLLYHTNTYYSIGIKTGPTALWSKFVLFCSQEETVKKQTTELRLIQERIIKLETNNTKLQMEKDVLEVRAAHEMVCTMQRVCLRSLCH